MNRVLRLSLSLLSLIFAISLVAQPTNCIDFSEFESGASYGQAQGNIPGELIYSSQGSNLHIDQIYGFNGGASFGQINVENDLDFGSEAPYLQLNGATAVFELDGFANNVCFITSNNGNAINLGINGGIGTFSNIADPSIQDSFPDFDISISIFDDTPFDPVFVCISGEIEQFAIGGFGIFLDNVCTDYYTNPNCGFFGPNIQAYCASPESINLSVGFNDIIGNNDIVDVFVNNEFYGFYPIEAFPLNLENITLEENQFAFEFSVCINDDPDCCYTEVVNVPDCMPESCVAFELFSEEMEIAFANDWPYDSVYHVENDVIFTQRQMYREGQLTPPNGLMLRLAPDAIPEFNTGSFITMGHVNAASQIDLSNYSELIYSASFDFYRFDDESFINIGVNGQEVAEPHGAFQGGSGTTTLPDGTVRRISYNPIDPNLGTVEFFGQNITEIFFGGEGVAMDNLCFNPTACEITNLTAGQFSCDGNEGLPARFFLDFDHNYLAQDSFILQIGPPGMFNTSTYAYADLPLTNIQIFGTIGQVFDFTVTDQTFNDCSASVTTQLNDCENACDNFAATTLEVYCTDPFFHEALVELSTIGVGQSITLTGLSAGFTQTTVLSNGNTVTFGYFEEDNDPLGYELLDGLTGCSVIIPPFPTPINDCMECFIEYANITPNECDENGIYSVTIEVVGVNFFQDYYVNIDGDQTYGPFQEFDFPLTIGEIQGGPNHIAFVEVFGVGGDCYYAQDIVQDCGMNNCDFFNPVLTSVECFDTDSLLLQVVLEGMTPDERPLLIQANNSTPPIELFFTQNPISFLLPNTGANINVFTITDLTTDCQETLEYQVPADCLEGCDGIFQFQAIECSDDGVPVIYFSAINPNGDIFTVTLDGVTETREYGDENYAIALPTFPGQDLIDIIFYDPASGCSLNFTIENPCFSCLNFNPVITAVECAEDTISLLILLDGEEPDFRELRFTDLNGNFITEELFTQNPFTIEFPLSNTDLGAIIIEDNSNNCEQILQYDLPPDCTDNCAGIFDLLEVVCNNDTGILSVYFSSDGPTGAPFFIEFNDEQYYFEHGEEVYLLELIPSPDQLVIDIEIFDETANCQTNFIFQNLCEHNCNNFNPFVLDVSCEVPNSLVLLNILLDGIEADGRDLQLLGVNGEVIEELIFTQNPFAVLVPLNNAGLVYLVDNTNGCEQALQYDIPEDCQTNCENFSADWVAFNCLESSDIELYFDIGGDIEPNGQLLQLLSLTSGNTIEVPFTENPLQVNWPVLDQGEIQISTEDGCSDITTYTAPEFCINDCIDTFELVAVECNESNEIRITITADGPAGASFTPFINDQFYPAIPYGGSQFVIEIPAVSGQLTYELILQDNASGCITTLLIDSPCFCIIENVSYSITECNEAGEWFLDLSFFGGSTSDEDQFEVSAGGYIQSFPQGTTNTTIGPFTNSNNDPLTVSIYAFSGNCEELIIIDYGCEPQLCEISDLSVVGSECDEAGNYFLDVTFNAEGAGLFEVSIANLELPTTFAAPGQTVSLGPINFNQVQTSIVIVEAIDAECIAEEVYVQECEPLDECNFTNVFAEAYDCDGDEFLVDIEFDNPFGGPLGFYIFGDGMIFGPYQYGETFYTFGPLDGSTSEHDILILDIADPACFANYSLNYSCSEECLIEELSLTPSACNDDGTFYVTVDVGGSNLGESFSVLGNGQNYGTFNYSNLPIEVGPFDGDNETIYELGVIDLDNPNCSAWDGFGPVNCNPCDIRDLTYEVICDNDAAGYTLVLDFIYENPTSDLFALQIGGELYESFSYESLPLTLTNIPLEFNGTTIRVEDVEDELCGETIDFNLPCCSMGNVLNELEVEACEENGEYYLSIHNFTGQNLSDTLQVDYAPAGESIIETAFIAYNDLPAQIGPLVGDGNTDYLVVLSDLANDCSVSTNIEAVFCDNGTCVEFEGENGVFGPNFGYDSGDLITIENEVAVSFERNPISNCECNLFITNGIPNVAFGEGQIIATLNAGFELDFNEVSQSFNTVNIDFYYPGGGLSMSVNGSDPVTVNSINDLPSSIAGVEIQVITLPNNPDIGFFTFNGAIENIQLFSNESAAFDNVCLSTDDNVWPGDTNTDNVASHFDLLNIGLTYGNTGPSRQEVTDDWAGLISANWSGDFADGVNHKHADANGDGVISEEDRLVILENYGLEHGPVTDFEALPYTDLAPPIYVDVSTIDEVNPGTTVQIPVIVGSAEQEMEDIYGLAFTIQLDPELIDMTSIQVIYPTSWFGEPGVNTSSIEKIYDDGRIEVALTRIDHNNVSGFGEVLSIRVIIDDIAGLTAPSEVILGDVLALNHNEERIVLRPETSQFLITSTEEEMDRDLLRSSFKIFPNPTQDFLYFSNQYGYAPDRITITDAAGRLISQIKSPEMHVDLGRYPAGVYFLQIHLQGYIFTERVVKTD